MPEIGLMGGSFNPIHCGHVALARAALERGRVERVLFLPTGNPPHKKEGLADKFDRLRMVELAVEHEAGMAVCREEIDRGGVIYTVDTLAALKRKMPDCTLTYLIGADTAARWARGGAWRRHRAMQISGNDARGRDAGRSHTPGRTVDAEGRADRLPRREEDGYFLDADSRTDTKGIALRAARAAGRRGLYSRTRALRGENGHGVEPMKREKMEYRLKKELDAARYAHTLGVEQTAREMARQFGEDEEKAALAGLLHDCAKCLPLSQMVKAAKDEKLDPVMKESKALMHAVAGMHLAQDVYDVHDPEVLGAIRWHTTGHANMTRLEKIVYLADMIEPNRKPYPGLKALRKLCMTDLDEAMHMALRMSLDHVREQGKPLHPDTMAALAEYEPKLV
ncbi:MAG: bis(5'-nucleosyl)-tetraphosphatase (symmetrical) YqeK [Christensenellales bacterium]